MAHDPAENAGPEDWPIGYADAREQIKAQLTAFQQQRRKLDVEHRGSEEVHLLQCGAAQIHQIIFAVADLGLVSLKDFPELMEVGGGLADISSGGVSPLFSSITRRRGRPRNPATDQARQNVLIALLARCQRWGFALNKSADVLAKLLERKGVQLYGGTVSQKQLLKWWDQAQGSGADPALVGLVERERQEPAGEHPKTEERLAAYLADQCERLRPFSPAQKKK
jgi:hypothetical protein